MNEQSQKSEKFEGRLTFDVPQGMFWIAKNNSNGIQLQFGDTFEVKVDDAWVETALDIASDQNGDLIFKLRNTPYEGEIEGLEARK